MRARSFLIGLLFAGGLGLSGMTLPSKVVGFLDLFGTWDPSLALVMVGAIGVYRVAFRISRSRARPLLADAYRLPTRRDIDRRLLGGATLFGVGWGIAGFCPGPAIVTAGSGSWLSVLFVVSMAGGMLAWQLALWVYNRHRLANASPGTAP